MLHGVSKQASKRSFVRDIENQPCVTYSLYTGVDKHVLLMIT